MFPLSCLPAPAADWAKMRSRQTTATFSAFAVAVLPPGIGVGSGRSPHPLRPKSNERNFKPNLWTMDVGPPGSKKSVVVKDIQRVLRVVETACTRGSQATDRDGRSHSRRRW